MFCYMYIVGVGGTVASGLVSLTLEHLEQAVWVNEPFDGYCVVFLGKTLFKLL